MATSIEVLPETDLAAVVGASNLDQALRETTGMCGCGILPGGDSSHGH